MSLPRSVGSAPLLEQLEARQVLSASSHAQALASPETPLATVLPPGILAKLDAYPTVVAEQIAHALSQADGKRAAPALAQQQLKEYRYYGPWIPDSDPSDTDSEDTGSPNTGSSSAGSS